jgi:uncharacterized membrane protein YecN with MAPEG domain
MSANIHAPAVYASILALMFVGLSVRTLGMRRRLKIAIGDAGNPTMLRAMRVHSNFAEYVPLSLLLMLLAAGSGAHPLLLHFLGLTLLTGRVVHAYGVSQLRENYRFRVAGMALTFTSIVTASLYLLFSQIGVLETRLSDRGKSPTATAAAAGVAGPGAI